MTFPLRTLDEVVDVRSGKRLPKGHDFADFATEHPYIRARDIRDGAITFDDPVYISEETHQVIKKYTVSTGDVCITIVGANVGDVGTVPEHLDGANLTENAVKLVNLKNLDSRYLKYILLSSELQRTMKLVAAGAAQPKLGLYKIKTLEIPYPSFPVQKRIADILSAYDDLIDNNNRRIALLEEAIHRLYREWFVHLRFPGHEHTPVVDGVPEGWEKRPLGDVCENVTDGTHDTPKPYDGSDGYPLVTGKHLVNGFIDFSSCYSISPSEHEIVMKRSRPETGDIIFSNIGTLGSTVLVEDDAKYSIKNVALFKPPSPPVSAFLFAHFSAPETLDQMLRIASGTSQKFLGLGLLRGVEILIPKESILEEWESVIRPMLRLRSNLNQQRNALREARDALLPRLMNGSLPV